MKSFLLVLVVLCVGEVFGWNARRESGKGAGIPSFTRETLQSGAGTRETRRSRLRAFLKEKGSLTQEEDDLLFIELSSLMNKEEEEEVSSRGRRSEDGATTTSGMTSREQQEALNVHNAMRRLEPAANMQTLTWNSDLADLAQEWATACRWGHGQPDNNFGSLGQNLYFIQGLDALNVTWSIIRWHDEKPYYIHENITCLKSPCGHYTQLVWGDTREVGCGFQMCAELEDIETGRIYRNAHHFVCNYFPTGNIPGKQPYTSGAACSACHNEGEYWCDRQPPRGLCSRNCSATDVDCVCGAECLNGGSAGEDCRCVCADGWAGDRCEKECKDYSEYCGVSPGYPKYTCTDKNHGEEIRELCPKLCDMCNVSSESITETGGTGMPPSGQETNHTADYTSTPPGDKFTNENKPPQTTESPSGENSGGIWWPVFPILAGTVILVVFSAGAAFVILHRKRAPVKSPASDQVSEVSNNTLLKLQDIQETKSRQSLI